MLVLLPPSESKCAPRGSGAAVHLPSLSFPGLTGMRQCVLDALIAAADRPDAIALLGVGPSLAAEVTRNARLRELPAVPAHEMYTGVLYDALGWATLPAAARRRGASRVVIASALWGALRPDDLVPPYRLSIGTALPGVGPLARAWREVLGPELSAAAGPRGLVVDCRSGAYAAAWTPAGALAARTVGVRVLREHDGHRTVVSHLAKHARGEVVRHLLVTGDDPRTPAELAEALAPRWTAELRAPQRPGRPWTVDVVLPH
ncbi:MAG TPA: peroxide stress protein YaaA [Kineosporiaceae bacterium]|nr:peroxide stress protein YaaA [Kineosporiaceae bacterium]